MQRPIHWLLLLASACGDAELCETEVWYVDGGRARDVSIIGPFNNWDPASDTLDEAHPGAWHTVLKLAPGDYEYMLRVDGVPTTDLYNPLLTWDEGWGTERDLGERASGTTSGRARGLATSGAAGSHSKERERARDRERRRGMTEL